MANGFSRLLIILSLIPAFNSCFTDEILSDTYGTRLIHEIWDGEIRIIYEYNEAGWPVAVKSKYYYNRYTYDRNNQLTRLEFFVDPAMYSSTFPQEDRNEWVDPENTECMRYFDYHHNQEGRLVAIETFSRWDGPFEMTGRTELDYGPEGRIARRKWYDADGNFEGFTTHTYDQRGNMIEQVKYFFPDTLSPESRITFQFDELKNPWQFFNQTGQPGRNMNPNNITSEIHDVYNRANLGGIEYHSENQTEYSYNPEGYPVRINDTRLVYH